MVVVGLRIFREGTEVTQDDRAPLIRLEVDQEVFIDTIRESDVIEDATVATEVTSFDRVGDAYVLEGAIVFAGYVTSVKEDTNEQAGFLNEQDVLALSGEGGDFVRHFHHRMPFVLRVPQTAQPRGIVNVTSRISSWNLEVVGASWIHVKADLAIVGLVGEDGYHFQCGSQDEGDLLLGNEAAVNSELQPTRSKANTDGETGLKSGVEFISETGAREVETLSFARGGHETASERHTDDGEVVSHLARFDRALEGSANQDGQHEGSSVSPEHRPSADALPPDGQPETELRQPAGFGLEETEGSENEENPYAEFEFTHQVPVSELHQPVQFEDHRQAETFVPSRSFSEGGFRPAEAFVHSNSIRDKHLSYESDDAFESGRKYEYVDDANAGFEETERLTSESTSRGEGVMDDSNKLWSFVDFHAPERYYTLRFVVVMEEETIESVADRVGCTRHDIVRLNHLVTDHVHAGQTILVPSYKSGVHR
jgi:hypothetical protein